MGSKVKAEFIIIIYHYIFKPSEAQWSYAVAELVQWAEYKVAKTSMSNWVQFIPDCRVAAHHDAVLMFVLTWIRVIGCVSFVSAFAGLELDGNI